MLRRDRDGSSRVGFVPVGPTVLKSAVLALAIAMSMPVAALAAPDTGSADTGSGDTGSADTGSGFGSSEGPNIDPNNYAQDCPDVLMVAVSGATDSESDRDPLDEQAMSIASNWVGNVTVPSGAANADSPGSVGWLYVPYASTYGVEVFDDVSTYQETIAEGIAVTDRLLNEYKTKCGNETKFVLLGYSVGGEVLDRVVRDIGHRDPDALVSGDDIAGVMMVGSPYRPAGAANFGDEIGQSGGGFMDRTPNDYGTLNGKVTWSCRPWDLACDAPDDIAMLQLALNVLGRMRFTAVNPVQTVSDFGRATSTIATRAIIDIATNKSWLTSDETLLQTLLKVSDQQFEPGDEAVLAELTPEQLLTDLNWAMGPGAEVVQAKLRAEGEGFAENNRGVEEVVLGPYLALGFLQHLSYWYNDAGDGFEWESEKMVKWVTDLARTEREKKDAPPVPSAPPVPDALTAPESATDSGYLQPEPGTQTRVSDLGAFLESNGIALPPEMFPPQYSTVPDRAPDLPRGGQPIPN